MTFTIKFDLVHRFPIFIFQRKLDRIFGDQSRVAIASLCKSKRQEEKQGIYCLASIKNADQDDRQCRDENPDVLSRGP